MIKPVKKAVFPVAGLGTRFLPATKAVPKEMLTVVDKPLIQYAVEEAAAAGIEEFIFVTGRDKNAIEIISTTPMNLRPSWAREAKRLNWKRSQDLFRRLARSPSLGSKSRWDWATRSGAREI